MDKWLEEVKEMIDTEKDIAVKNAMVEAVGKIRNLKNKSHVKENDVLFIPEKDVIAILWEIGKV